MTAITLNPAQRSALRGLAHDLDVTVHIGQGGASAAVLKEVDVALAAHGLIKVRVLAAERAEREDMFAVIANKLFCAAVQHIGKILILWRPRPEDSIQTQATPLAPPVSSARSGTGRPGAPAAGDRRRLGLREPAGRGTGPRSSASRSPSTRSRGEGFEQRERRGHGAKPPERGAFSVDRTRNDEGDRPRAPRRTEGEGFGGSDRPRAPRAPRAEFGSDRPRAPRRSEGEGFGGSDRPRAPRAPRAEFGSDRSRAPHRSEGEGFGGSDRPRAPRAPKAEFGGDRPRASSTGRPRSAAGDRSPNPRGPRKPTRD